MFHFIIAVEIAEPYSLGVKNSSVLVLQVGYQVLK